MTQTCQGCSGGPFVAVSSFTLRPHHVCLLSACASSNSVKLWWLQGYNRRSCSDIYQSCNDIEFCRIDVLHVMYCDILTYCETSTYSQLKGRSELGMYERGHYCHYCHYNSRPFKYATYTQQTQKGFFNSRRVISAATYKYSSRMY